MSTSYVFKELVIDENTTLYVDGNSKITVGNGTYDAPKPNAFSLPHISTCPGATKECMSACYIYGLQNNAPEVYKMYARNEQAMHRILMAGAWSKLAKKASDVLSEFIKSECTDGFRWHVSGDVMNDRYADWIMTTAGESEPVRNWLYTRSLGLIERMTEKSCRANNLIINVSADAENYAEARSIADEFNLRLCYLTRDGNVPDDMQKGDVIFPDYSLRGRELDDPTEHTFWKSLSSDYKKMVCPADFFGQSEQHRCGPCKKCLVQKSAT